MPASSGIVDSSIIIDHLRGQPQAAEHLAVCRASGRLIAHAVVTAEVLTGARDRKEQETLDRFLALFTVEHPNAADSAMSLDLFLELRLGHGIGWLDCLIAATCIRGDLPIITLNDKHFAAVRGLQVIRPY